MSCLETSDAVECLADGCAWATHSWVVDPAHMLRLFRCRDQPDRFQWQTANTDPAILVFRSYTYATPAEFRAAVLRLASTQGADRLYWVKEPALRGSAIEGQAVLFQFSERGRLAARLLEEVTAYYSNLTEAQQNALGPPVYAEKVAVLLRSGKGL